MPDTLVPRLLDRTMIDQAFPLVRNLVAGMTLDRWSRFARAQIVSRSASWPHGLMTIQNPKGYILSLFAFEVRDDLCKSRTLCVDNIVVPNIPGRDLIWQAVVGATEQLARMNGCRAIRAGLADELDPSESDRAWVVDSLRKSGFELEGVRAFKHLAEGDKLAANGNGADNEAGATHRH